MYSSIRIQTYKYNQLCETNMSYQKVITLTNFHVSNVNEHSIDKRLFKIYKMLSGERYEDLMEYMLTTIWLFSNNDSISHVVETLDVALIECAKCRYSKVHDIIRNLHFSIVAN